MENVEDMVACSYKEVMTILSLLPDDDWNKIPNERKNFYFQNMKKDYVFNFDSTKPLSMQKLLPRTEAILGNLFKNYLATPEEKQEIIDIENKEYIRIEDEKRKKYNPDNLFPKENKITINNENLPIELPKNKLYAFFRNLFYKWKNRKNSNKDTMTDKEK